MRPSAVLIHSIAGVLALLLGGCGFDTVQARDPVADSCLDRDEELARYATRGQHQVATALTEDGRRLDVLVGSDGIWVTLVTVGSCTSVAETGTGWQSRR